MRSPAMAAASDPVVIVSAARTPLGRFMGDLSPFAAHQLGSHVIGAAVERAKLSPDRIDEVFMGCVLPAGQGQAPAASSANADGAAALILAKRSLADRDGLAVLAEIKGHATHSQEPQWVTTAPIPAIHKLLDKIGWSTSDVDLFEINEAFAVVAQAAQRDLGIPRKKLNI